MLGEACPGCARRGRAHPGFYPGSPWSGATMLICVSAPLATQSSIISAWQWWLLEHVSSCPPTVNRPQGTYFDEHGKEGQIFNHDDVALGIPGAAASGDHLLDCGALLVVEHLHSLEIRINGRTREK